MVGGDGERIAARTGRRVIELEQRGEVFILRLDAGENRFSPDVITEVNRRLDEVEKHEGPHALVTTGTGKFFSNGLDLDWMMGEGREDASGYLSSVLRILARVLTFPAATVAAINGHAFGAGGQLALAHDERVMRADRGFFCMPEIDMRAPLHPGMTALIQARLPAQTAHECITTGRRYGGIDALSAGIVDHAVPEGEVLARAVARAEALADNAHPVLRELKQGLYPAVLEALALPLGVVASSS
jgi:enoyl-CoA hydratase/carnithine racemase